VEEEERGRESYGINANILPFLGLDISLITIRRMDLLRCDYMLV
jgi:hypothetical protein